MPGCSHWALFKSPFFSHLRKVLSDVHRVVIDIACRIRSINMKVLLLHLIGCKSVCNCCYSWSGQLLNNHAIYYCGALLPPNWNIELISTRTFVFHSPLFIWLAKHWKTSIIKPGSSKSLALLEIQQHIKSLLFAQLYKCLFWFLPMWINPIKTLIRLLPGSLVL